MPRKFLIAAPLVALLMLGCGDNPAENVPNVTATPPKAVSPASTPETPNPAAVSASAPAVTASAAAPAPVSEDALVITPATSKIEFIGAKKVGGSHNGGFKAFNGTAELATGKPELKTVAVDIDTTSLFADDDKLTAHLKNQDFFEVDKYPTAKFVTTEIKTGGDKGATHTLVGNLTLHGVTKSISIPATVKVDGATLTLTSEFALNKNDFGMTFSGPGGVIRDEVVIKLNVKAAKKG